MSQTAQLAQLLGVGQFAKILYNDKWRIGIVESKKVGPSGDVLTLKLDNAEGYRSMTVSKMQEVLVAPRMPDADTTYHCPAELQEGLIDPEELERWT